MSPRQDIVENINRRCDEVILQRCEELEQLRNERVPAPLRVLYILCLCVVFLVCALFSALVSGLEPLYWWLIAEDIEPRF